MLGSSLVYDEVLNYTTVINVIISTQFLISFIYENSTQNYLRTIRGYNLNEKNGKKIHFHSKKKKIMIINK